MDKKSVWDITDLMYVTSRVSFEEDVTKEQALDLWSKGIFEDVLDNFYGEVVEIGTNAV